MINKKKIVKKQIERELEWIRQSPKARQAKNKARIKAYDSFSQPGRKDYDVGVAKIVIPDGPRLGNIVIDINHLTKKFGDRVLYDNFDLTIPPGSIVGIIGPNGVGKTTLFKMITGQDNDYQGEVKIGETVVLGSVDQSRDSLNDKHTVWEEISDKLDNIQLGDKVVRSRSYCASFNFKGGDQQKLVSQLSGGERNRVHLAKMLRKSSNVLLLDEPTNDLDVNTFAFLLKRQYKILLGVY
jgi:energy-dependent translational throttle protein EttA